MVPLLLNGTSTVVVAGGPSKRNNPALATVPLPLVGSMKLLPIQSNFAPGALEMIAPLPTVSPPTLLLLHTADDVFNKVRPRRTPPEAIANPPLAIRLLLPVMEKLLLQTIGPLTVTTL